LALASARFVIANLAKSGRIGENKSGTALGYIMPEVN